MTGMTRKGVRRRVVDLRSAANRLRWEVDLTLGVWPNAHTPTNFDYIEANGIVSEIAETVAILRVTLDTMQEKIPEQHQGGFFSGSIRERLAERLEFYLNYHQVGR